MPCALDHFLSYGVRESKTTAAFVPRGPVTFADAFGEHRYDVGRPLALALPVATNLSLRSDALTHLLEYPIKLVKGETFAPHLDLHLSNVCSDVFLAVTKPVSLLVPTAMKLDGAATPPVEADHQVDHFLCYQAKVQTKLTTGQPLAKLPKGTQLGIASQFEGRRYDLKGIKKICLPGAKSGQPVFLKGENKGTPAALPGSDLRHPEPLLVCYQAKIARTVIPQLGCRAVDPKDKGFKIVPPIAKHISRTGIFVANQLGELRLDSLKEHEFCVPSRLLP
jgi:hypothetical protein